jgi:CMP-N-acetylneuraminic acid synthetase
MVLLNGKPLLQYAIDSAKKSGVFGEIVVTSDWDRCLDLAEESGVKALARPAKLCTDESHDLEFVKHALGKFKGFDVFAILRPTSPFRTAETIRRAMMIFINTECDSMRAVARTPAHPRKSWVMTGDCMEPYSPGGPVRGFPAYDMPTQDLGDVYVQNGCIHIAWVETVVKYGNVSGKKIAPFHTKELEGIDINSPMDLMYADWIMRGGK